MALSSTNVLGPTHSSGMHVVPRWPVDPPLNFIFWGHSDSIQTIPGFILCDILVVAFDIVHHPYPFGMLFSCAVHSVALSWFSSHLLGISYFIHSPIFRYSLELSFQACFSFCCFLYGAKDHGFFQHSLYTGNKQTTLCIWRVCILWLCVLCVGIIMYIISVLWVHKYPSVSGFSHKLHSHPSYHLTSSLSLSSWISNSAHENWPHASSPLSCICSCSQSTGSTTDRAAWCQESI